MPRLTALAPILFALAGASCSQTHSAKVRTAALPPPPDPTVRHASPLWVELDPGVKPTQCVTPKGERKLCFEEVDKALGESFTRALWTSFPSVKVVGYSDVPGPTDYVLKVDLALAASSPVSGGPGWAAVATGSWQVQRGGRELAGERVQSRSRADFAYGRPLGVGASEVVDAIAQHVGGVLASLPESMPERPVPLPPVAIEALPTAKATLAKGK